MGWLGWTPDQAMGADVNAIIIALEGRHEMLGAIFGTKEKPGESKRSGRGATVDQFQAWKKRTNRAYYAKQRRSGKSDDGGT